MERQYSRGLGLLPATLTHRAPWQATLSLPARRRRGNVTTLDRRRGPQECRSSDGLKREECGEPRLSEWRQWRRGRQLRFWTHRRSDIDSGEYSASQVTGAAVDSTVVHLTGTETITGAKTFSSDVSLSGT